MNCYRICKAAWVRRTSEGIKVEKHIPPFLGKVFPSPGTIRSTVTPWWDGVGGQRRVRERGRRTMAKVQELIIEIIKER